MKNPLLSSSDLPLFNKIEVEHIEPAIHSLIDHNREQTQQQLAQLKSGDGDIDWQTLVEPIQAREDELEKAWAPVSHLNGVKNSGALRDVYNRCIQTLTEYSTEMSQNQDLCAAYQHVKNSPDYAQLDQARKKTIDNALRDFRLAGVDLPEQARKRYGEIRKRLSELGNQFSNNVLDSTQGWYKHIVDESELQGLPESARLGAQQAAQQRGLDGWALTLDGPAYIAVMTHADNRTLREEIYRAYVTRASGNSYSVEDNSDTVMTNQWDNHALMQETLALRHELAQLLGFNNYAELSLATKMAADPEEVFRFLNQLLDASKPSAQQELQTLKNFAASEFGIDQLEAWDLPYYAEKYRQAVYDISEEQLRPYFPVEKVKQGLFDIAGRLFDIAIELDNSVATWNADAQFYRVKRHGQAIAGFYLDLFARSDKRGGAWMAECRSRRHTQQGLQLPVAFLTCNFMPPTQDVPCLLTHSDVCTLFHEFGHGLHHMLTQIDSVPVAGINGVAWDAVELPSQFLENWCWQTETIPLISSHYQSGEPLPTDLLQKLLSVKNYQAAMQMLRQLEFALFDFELHADYQAEHPADPQDVLNKVRERVAVAVTPAFNKFQNSFTHIFAGGYAAGYYSYKWAEVLSADAFSLFEEKGLFDRDTAQSFLSNILEKGGSEDAKDLFIRFRGRQPSVEPLLRHNGIVDGK